MYRVRVSPALFAAVVGLGFLVAGPAQAEQCPGNRPTWLRGRVAVFEPNLPGGQVRGLGEIFVYAFRRGDSQAGSRYMAVTDPDGHFCIHDTPEGPWVVTSFEPFSFRPFVLETQCTAAEPAGCSLGTIRVDSSLFRLSDDYVNYENDWWGGPFAQTVVAPSGSRSAVKVTFRSGAGGTSDVELYRGETVASGSLGRAGLIFPNGGGRGTAVFAPGAVPLAPGELHTVLLGGGSGPWRLKGNAYPQGKMFNAGGGSLSEIPDKDLCLAMDIDGPDGLLTNFLVLGTPSYAYANRVAQSFVARSSEITHASMVTGFPTGFHRIRAFISETADGPPIGPVKETIGLNEQGVAFAWFRGEVVVTPGKRYFLRYEFPDGGRAIYTREKDPLNQPVFPGGTLSVDGSPQAGAITGRVMGPAEPAVIPDAGVPGGGVPDGGATQGDAGTTPSTPGADGGTNADGGQGTTPTVPVCGCSSVGPGLGLAAAVAMALRRRRRALP